MYRYPQPTIKTSFFHRVINSFDNLKVKIRKQASRVKARFSNSNSAEKAHQRAMLNRQRINHQANEFIYTRNY